MTPCPPPPMRTPMPLAYHFHCALRCLILSASAAVKVFAIQNGENVARKVVKMFKTSLKNQRFRSFASKKMSLVKEKQNVI